MNKFHAKMLVIYFVPYNGNMPSVSKPQSITFHQHILHRTTHIHLNLQSSDSVPRAAKKNVIVPTLTCSDSSLPTHLGWLSKHTSGQEEEEAEKVGQRRKKPHFHPKHFANHIFRPDLSFSAAQIPLLNQNLIPKLKCARTPSFYGNRPEGRPAGNHTTIALR